MIWNQSIYAPITNEVPFNEVTRPNSSLLHELNEGDILNLFGEQKTLKLGVIVNVETCTGSR